MKQTITKSMFIDAFHQAGRGDQFSREALEAIFDYIESYEQDSGEEVELDVIAVCCDWSEDEPREIAYAYNIDISECNDDEEVSDTVFDYLNDNSAYAEQLSNGQIVYVQF